MTEKLTELVIRHITHYIDELSKTAYNLLLINREIKSICQDEFQKRKQKQTYTFHYFHNLKQRPTVNFLYKLGIKNAIIEWFPYRAIYQRKQDHCSVTIKSSDIHGGKIHLQINWYWGENRADIPTDQYWWQNVLNKAPEDYRLLQPMYIRLRGRLHKCYQKENQTIICPRYINVNRFFSTIPIKNYIHSIETLG
jgi:hypothetical protein